MALYVFGDSHSAFCFDRVPEAQIHWLGARTMHRFSSEASSVLQRCVGAATPGDVFVFVFGEIDVRCHLLKVATRTGAPLSAVIEDLAERYALSIACAMTAFEGCHAVLLQPPFPTDRRPNPDLPFVGTLDQRIEAHRMLSVQLNIEAHKHGIKYLGFPKKYSAQRGDLCRKYSDDGVHIMPVEAGKLVSSLSSLLGKRLSFERAWGDIFARRINYYTGKKLRRRGGMRRHHPRYEDV